MRNRSQILLLASVLTASLFLTREVFATRADSVCRSIASTFSDLFNFRTQVAASGPEELLLPVRRWLTTQQSYLLDIKMTLKLGEVVNVAGSNATVIAKLGHGAEGDVYLVKTSAGLQTLKTFFDPAGVEAHLQQLTMDFPIASPRIFRTDARHGRVLMEYIEGASVDHIMGRWQKMGLTATQKDKILNAWADEQKRIRSQGKWPPDGFNVVYSFRTQTFYRVDSI